MLLAAHSAIAWNGNAACCSYPEHDPRDYNWPYSHFQYSEVIPDVMGSFVSMTELNLTYVASTGSVDVAYGKPLAPAQVARPPAVSFALDPDRDENTLHTMLMVDPDVPHRDTPSDGEWAHWLVYDIPGNSTARGKTLIEYSPPTPKPCPSSDTLCLEEHRVTFILWEQPHGPLELHAEDVFIDAHATSGRRGYKARDFAARHRLGLHIGMNFFETRHDPEEGTFDKVPRWHVRDDESLVVVGEREDRKRKDEL